MGISGYSLGGSIDHDPPKNTHLVQVPKSDSEPSLWQGVRKYEVLLHTHATQRNLFVFFND